jgi:uncharacterized protein YcbX
MRTVPMRTVVKLAIAPVKSMRLQPTDRIELEPFGVAGNRRFYVADSDGRMLNAGRHGRLLSIVPRYQSDDERLTLTFPDGTGVDDDAANVGEAVRSSFYGRPVEGHEVLGPWRQALSSFLGLPVRLVRTDNPGDAIDSHAVSMFSSASAEELDRHGGRDGRPLDRRRWRMLVEVGGCVAHEEDSWIGRDVRVGEAVVRVVRTDLRCVITTRDPDTGQKEFDTLKVIAAYRGAGRDGGLPFGVYADVVRSGPASVGDAVEPVEAARPSA